MNRTHDGRGREGSKVNEEDVPPVISQVSRLIVFGGFALFVILFAWMAGTLLLPWIKTGSPPPTFTGRRLARWSWGRLHFSGGAVPTSPKSSIRACPPRGYRHPLGEAGCYCGGLILNGFASGGMSSGSGPRPPPESGGGWSTVHAQDPNTIVS
jgi:hypothetical protein